MFLSQFRENPMIERKKFISTGRPVAVTIVLIFESQAFHIPLVEQVETNRKETVRRLTEQFENHPNRNMLLKHFEKSEINHFSQESKNLITEMGNTEIFEFYESSSKRQCPDCASCWMNWYRILHMRKMHAACGKVRKRVDNSIKTDLTHRRFLDT